MILDLRSVIDEILRQCNKIYKVHRRKMLQKYEKNYLNGE